MGKVGLRVNENTVIRVDSIVAKGPMYGRYVVKENGPVLSEKKKENGPELDFHAFNTCLGSFRCFDT